MKMRLTDDRTAKALKEISDKLKAGGFEVDVSNERYVRLAEYERFGKTPEYIEMIIRNHEKLVEKVATLTEKILCYEQGWISIYEGLPKNCKEVLICTDKGNITTAMIFMTVNKSDYPYWLSRIGNKPIETEYGKVTHWRYLPEPPKEV